MSVKKLFSIIIASLALLLFIFTFIPYIGPDFDKRNLWAIGTSFGVFSIISYIAIIAAYLLNIFGILKDKWMHFANYLCGYVVLSHLTYLFNWIDYTRVGIWLGTIVAIGLGTLSVLWYFVSDNPMGGAKKGKKITGYDPQTGKPIYAKPKGYDPQTGEPIYE